MILQNLMGQWEGHLREAENLRNQFKYDEALPHYDSALNNCNSCPDTVLAKVYLGMGKTLQNLNNLGEATSYIEKAYQKRLHFKNINPRLYIEISLAEILRASHSIADAMSRMDIVGKSIEKNRRLVADSIISYYYNRLTPIQSEAGLPPQIVEKTLYKALEYAEQIEDTAQIILLYRELSRLNNKEGSRDLSLRSMEKAIHLAKHYGDPRMYADALISQMFAYNSFHEYEKSKNVALELLPVLNAHNFTQTRLDLYRLLSQVYRKLNDFEKAVLYADSAYNTYQLLFDETWQEKVGMLTQTLELEKKELALENEKLAKASVENELKQSQQRETFNRNILFVGGLALCLLIGLSVLLFKNYQQQKKLAREREFLIREVHHRVKNNLQSLAGLLSLQMNYLQDPSQIDLLQKVFRRVNAIALTHSMLYNNQNPNLVNAKSYLTELIKEIQLSEQGEGKEFDAEITPLDVQIDFDQAVCLGIITNELITNSLKHAKPKEDQLKISLDLRMDNEKALYTYRDNGASLKEKDSKHSMGLRLIEIALKRIGGEKREVEIGQSPFACSFSFLPNNK